MKNAHPWLPTSTLNVHIYNFKRKSNQIRYVEIDAKWIIILSFTGDSATMDLFFAKIPFKNGVPALETCFKNITNSN